jgi:hypothetical protein
MFDAGVNEVEYADQVHVYRVDERLDARARRQRSDPGIGDHDVEAPELGNPPVDRRRQRGAVADVRDLGVGALTLLLDQSGGLVEVLRPRQRILVARDVRADVDGDDVRALGSEQLGVRSTLTTRRSADQRHLAGYPAHRRTSIRSLVCLEIVVLQHFQTHAIRTFAQVTGHCRKIRALE